MNEEQQQMLHSLADTQNKMAGVIEYVTKLSQSIAQQNETTNARHLSTLEQQNILLQLTNTLATSIQTQHTKPLSLASDPKFPIFRQTSQTIKEWIQEINERATILQLPEPTKVLYAKLAMPAQKGHLHEVTDQTSWNDFKTLIISKFEPRHATHDLIQRLRSTKMHKHDLQNYINAFERLKHLIPAEAQSDTDMMYTFINGLSDELRSKLMSKDLTTYQDAVTECWRYYMAKSYGQDEYRPLPDSHTPMDLDRKSYHKPLNRYSRSRSRSRSQSSTRRLSSYRHSRSPFRPTFRSRSRSHSRPSFHKHKSPYRDRSRSFSGRRRSFSNHKFRSRSRSFSNSKRFHHLSHSRSRSHSRSHSRSKSHHRHSRSPRRHSHIARSKSPKRSSSRSPRRSQSPIRLRTHDKLPRSQSPHKDHARRCYNCGSTDHLAATCPKKLSYTSKKLHSMSIDDEDDIASQMTKTSIQDRHPRSDFPKRR